MNRRVVLIVDDYRDTAESLADYFTLSGCRSRLAFSAADALAELHAGGIDAVVLDQRLPNGSGLGLLEWMRGCGEEAPAVLVTAVDAVESDVISKELDRLRPAALFRKPADPAELLAALKRMCDEREGKQ